MTERRAIPQPFLDWKDTTPRVTMTKFCNVASVFRGVENSFQVDPTAESFNYVYACGKEADEQGDIIEGVDKQFLFSLWRMRQVLRDDLIADNRQAWADAVIQDIDKRYSRLHAPVRR